MNANSSQESDSHLSRYQISLRDKAKYLIQLGCFWLVLSTYLYPFCKQKFNQAFSGNNGH
ncbi:hypothetical protein GCM10011520_09370 [Shewanella carassii]|uniref:Uncharacterized protein n=1 Tax=Shewanella carassii TaxID=1987584 RepID=A0ABQ1T0V6_9GAMM|nr:hypothetical protein GCM10011520_09370 [Shewanella carassii]